jgi:hypothetical protein
VLIRMSFRRSALLVLLLAVLVALAVAAGAWFGYLRFAAAPIAGPAPGPVSWSGAATVSVPLSVACARPACIRAAITNGCCWGA